MFIICLFNHFVSPANNEYMKSNSLIYLFLSVLFPFLLPLLLRLNFSLLFSDKGMIEFFSRLTREAIAQRQKSEKVGLNKLNEIMTNVKNMSKTSVWECRIMDLVTIVYITPDNLMMHPPQIQTELNQSVSLVLKH